mmetsp:Transcript_21332/g.67489  ORF Transcript_21332/g.67489 Transcript_21332/m.67489 type:complete len:223 (-) Transcript_21332:1094-1762(-)
MKCLELRLPLQPRFALLLFELADLVHGLHEGRLVAAHAIHPQAVLHHPKRHEPAGLGNGNHRLPLGGGHALAGLKLRNILGLHERGAELALSPLARSHLVLEGLNTGQESLVLLLQSRALLPLQHQAVGEVAVAARVVCDPALEPLHEGVPHSREEPPPLQAVHGYLPRHLAQAHRYHPQHCLLLRARALVQPPVQHQDVLPRGGLVVRPPYGHGPVPLFHI